MSADKRAAALGRLNAARANLSTAKIRDQLASEALHKAEARVQATRKDYAEHRALVLSRPAEESVDALRALESVFETYRADHAVLHKVRCEKGTAAAERQRLATEEGDAIAALERLLPEELDS